MLKKQISKKINEKWDNPRNTTVALVTFVITHYILTILNVIPNIWSSVEQSPLNTSIYLSLTGLGATLTGFAGVVVIFSLTESSKRHIEFRAYGHEKLPKNWYSILLAGISVSAAGIISAIIAVTPLYRLAPWIFELGALIALHGLLRLFWILKLFISISMAEDRKKQVKEESVDESYFH